MKQYLIPILLLLIGLFVGYFLAQSNVPETQIIIDDVVTNELPRAQAPEVSTEPTTLPTIAEVPILENNGENYCQELKSNIPGSEGFTVTTNTASGMNLQMGHEIRGCVYSVNDSYGGWAPFEGQVGSFSLLGSDGDIISEGPLSVVNSSNWIDDARAGNDIEYQGQIMSDDEITGTGTLLLRNENASGEPAYDKVITIPVSYELFYLQ